MKARTSTAYVKLTCPAPSQAPGHEDT